MRKEPYLIRHKHYFEDSVHNSAMFIGDRSIPHEIKLFVVFLKLNVIR